MTTRSRCSWDKLPKESPPAYDAFLTYLKEGPQRSVRKTAAELCRGTTQLTEWSSKHQWVRRAGDWDADQGRQFLEEMTTERRRAARAHIRIAQALQSKVVDRLRTMDPDKLTPRDLAYWLEVATRVEREALGVPHRYEHSGPNGDPIQIEESLPDDELELLAELAAIGAILRERLGDDDVDVLRSA